jgi:superfamily II DNA or RNA helicase
MIRDLIKCNDTAYVLRVSNTDIAYNSDTTYIFLTLMDVLCRISVPRSQVREVTDGTGDIIAIVMAESPYDLKMMDISKSVSYKGCALIEQLSKVSNMPIRDSCKPAPTEDNELEYCKNMLSDIRIEGRYRPMEHQFKAALFKASHSRSFDLSTMRTGKTGSTIMALEYLFRTDKIKRALILAPLSCVNPVWVDAIKTTIPRHVCMAAIGSKTQRMKAFNSFADIIVANYECVKLMFDELKTFKPDAIIIDEHSNYANDESQRYKFLKNLISTVNPAFVCGMTGTPGHDPIKAFCMSKLVNPSAVACKTKRAWQGLTMYRWGTEPWQIKNRECAPQLIRNALSPAILFKKDELFDLPPVMYTAREVTPSTEVARHLESLRDNMIVMADEKGDEIKAQQKSVLVMKLLQCATGAVYTESGEIKELDTSNRTKEILSLIGEASGKTVIFSPFTGCIRHLSEALNLSGIKCAVVDGSTSEKKRSDIFRKFQYEPKGQSDVDVLIAHPRTTAFGVELAAADMMIFDGAPLSGDFVFGQAVERMSSLKQKSDHVTIAQVYSCAEERKVFTALLDGRKESDVVADLFKFVTDR